MQIGRRKKKKKGSREARVSLVAMELYHASDTFSSFPRWRFFIETIRRRKGKGRNITHVVNQCVLILTFNCVIKSGCMERRGAQPTVHLAIILESVVRFLVAKSPGGIAKDVLFFFIGDKSFRESWFKQKEKGTTVY